ncbi:RNA-dependent RNA polymerase [Colletotrichum truncatum]|uniref:RNA-dependent RNA polymerase n=1 Tax=Colletotrichum truncatum TaxID=5467 RepID=A0ACC3Z848_COLTU|nr:RNA-dependent RNA polymerase [Colletotrichum truncatum]KAF6783637.1 RNA-dependent RNA polymerase [Colletotrichum truncatum]
MEVFLANLPQPLTDRTLGHQLRPYMNALGITDWSCFLSKNRKDIGWVIFLNPKDGVDFLSRHGKQPLSDPTISIFNQAPNTPPVLFPSNMRNKRSRDKANLHLMNIPVYASKSKRDPDPFEIKRLRDGFGDQAKKCNQPDSRANNSPIVFSIRELKCGHNSFRNEAQELTFVEQHCLFSRGHAKFGKRLLVLNVGEVTKIEIPYSSIFAMINSSTSCTFTVVLTEPPRFYKEKSPLELLSTQMLYGHPYHQQKQFLRCTSIPDDPAHATYAGSCLVYQIRVVDPDYHRKLKILEKRSMFNIAHSHIAHDQNPKPKTHDYQTTWELFYDHISTIGANRSLPFRLLFLVQSLVWNNFLHPFVAFELVIKIELLFKKTKAAKQPEPLSENTIRNLRDGYRDSLPFPVHDTDPQSLDAAGIFSSLLEMEDRIQDEADYRDSLFRTETLDHHVPIFKATVTPTRITLHGPELDSSNRVLRKFSKHTDYFMRVQFCDEDGTNLLFNPKISNDEIFQRFTAVLTKGIPVAGRVYKFLGFSHSSLRSHSVWFAAPFVDDSGTLQFCAKIIRSLGDFEQIQIPAKCAARIGQAFSETPSFVSLTENDIGWRAVPDVKFTRGQIERVFSDGVGTISQEALELIWSHLPQKHSNPTCLQIRWGGVKGMLSLDSRLSGRVMCIRKESMEKFPSKDVENLEICDTASKPLKLVLNRQMIKIMEDLGVTEQFFRRLQKLELDQLRAVTAKPYNTGTFLHMQGIGLNCFLPALIRSLDRYEIDYRQDDFLRTVVESTVLRELRLLKHKARIPVPQGVTLFGIMDETGFLGEGEVYVCYDMPRRRSKPVIGDSLRDGAVLVTRSPALHPGDIQVAQMRTPPRDHPLRNLRNCIVFSQHGCRDLPSQLSGGDLDGDLYNIIWDPDAIPKYVSPAADYARVVPPSLGRQVQTIDMANWFVDFMKSDVLGSIANRHLILADQNPKGTFSPDCLKLAEMHSTAVDFSKTGIPVNPSEIPKAGRARPDFFAPAPPARLYDREQIELMDDDNEASDDDEDMSGPSYSYYKSEKILGVLFRNVDEKKIWDEDIRTIVSKSGPSVWSQLAGLIQRKVDVYSEGRVSWKTKRDDAKRLRDIYEDTISNFMVEYSESYMKPLTEVEVFCGSIFNRSGSQTRRQKDNSKKLKVAFDRLCEWLVAQIRQRPRRAGQGGLGTSAVDSDYSQAPGSREDGDGIDRRLETNREALEMSYACFMADLLQEGNAADERTPPIHSFRVIAASVLLRELTELANRVKGGQLVDPIEEDAIVGGGFVGVTSGPAISYAYNGYDVDVGQYPNYGYSKYL